MADAAKIFIGTKQRAGRAVTTTEGSLFLPEPEAGRPGSDSQDRLFD